MQKRLQYDSRMRNAETGGRAYALTPGSSRGRSAYACIQSTQSVQCRKADTPHLATHMHTVTVRPCDSRAAPESGHSTVGLMPPARRYGD